MTREETAKRGEDAAAAYLERIGCTVVERNWRCPSGEVDIVALDGPTLLIVEVKTRKTPSAGTPEEAVSPTKQRRLVRIARHYLAHAGLDDADVRFDVIAIRPIADDRALLRHHRAAFTA
ncbi:MAG: YraN family protein [Anaerosomatales bacterium]|nr:YraN family protein [Anaerosomatales bacterium]MDT8433398.1 YraN family protein [Anaerosomatales bacterium]